MSVGEDLTRHAATCAPIDRSGGHQAEAAADEADQDLGFALLARDEKARAEIEDAITRIMLGTYGICEASGRPIPAERLRALPWCRFDREAEEAREAGAARTRGGR